MAGLHSTQGAGLLPWFLIDTDVVPLCAEVDPDSFFPKDYFDDENGKSPSTSYENERGVKAICNECPLKIDCLTYAIQSEQQGIWGGTTEAERYAIRRGRGLKLQKALGLAPTKRTQIAVK